MLRALLFILLLAIALMPLAGHFALWALPLVRSGHRGVALLSLLGAVAWFTLWLHALPVFRRSRR
jgi:hypothetical protein